MPRHSPPSQRRGNYAILFVLAIPVVLGFGALALDTSYIRLAQSQTQDIADAASQAALIELRRTGSVAAATDAAEDVVALNIVAGEPPELESLEFGVWDEDDARLRPGGIPNAVRATVGRDGGNSIPLYLAQIWGYDSFTTNRSATSASRKLQVILVMDITNSWSADDFDNARTAAVRFFDTINDSHGPDDQIGMTVFTNRFGWEYTPMMEFDNPGRVAATRADWVALRTASKAGRGPATYPASCSEYGGSRKNDFSDPEGGCFPNMPREYRDEPGTDHTTGMQMAWTMFDDAFDPTAFRVMLVLTDGKPNGLGSPGTARAADGYTETRWREFVGDAPRSASSIRSGAIDMTQAMWDDLDVHTYVVSFDANETFMSFMPQGQGYYINTSDSAALVPIFSDIANSLPLALVE